MNYIHRFMAYSFSNYKDTLSILSKIELYSFIVHGEHKMDELKLLDGHTILKCHQLPRPLILGSITTRLAISLISFDTIDNDLHIGNTQAPLDLGSLDGMGFIHLSDGTPYFGPPHPPVPRDQYLSSKKKDLRKPPAATPAQPNLKEFMEFVLTQFCRMDDRINLLQQSTWELNGEVDALTERFT